MAKIKKISRQTANLNGITKKELRKGLFFTLSIVFLIPAIITIWTLSATETNFENSFIVDRIYDLSTSVSSCIRDIFYKYYDTKISIEEGNLSLNVTFIENISANKTVWGQRFNTTISNFRNFVEMDEPSVKLNLTGLQQKETPSVIYPYNITYSRKWGTGYVIINVTPDTIDFNSYDITVNSSSIEIDNVSAKIGTLGTFSFTVTAVDNYGHKITNKSSVDPSDNHRVQIFLKKVNKTIKIDLANNNLGIWTNATNSTIISTKIDGLPKTDELVTVSTFKDVINVSFPRYKSEKISSIEIAEQ